jgi:hypothetical protein
MPDEVHTRKATVAAVLMGVGLGLCGRDSSTSDISMAQHGLKLVSPHHHGNHDVQFFTPLSGSSR